MASKTWNGLLRQFGFRKRGPAKGRGHRKMGRRLRSLGRGRWNRSGGVYQGRPQLTRRRKR